MSDHVDVLIVGAGLSGIGAAYRLQTMCKGKTYTILESRNASGGTWDLFRYPGIRSDSDMYTLSYPFKPWTHGNAIADGEDIRRYIHETAHENKIDEQIRHGHRVTRASWSSDEAQWTIDATTEDGPVVITASFLYLCSGYYNYDAGFTPEFPGLEDFEGEVVHPQFWTDDVDYDDKEVVVIGSGATAVTLIPSMADRTKHVTMLQRSPTYITSLPQGDPIASGLRKVLPLGLAHRLTFGSFAFSAYSASSASRGDMSSGCSAFTRFKQSARRRSAASALRRRATAPRTAAGRRPARARSGRGPAPRVWPAPPWRARSPAAAGRRAWRPGCRRSGRPRPAAPRAGTRRRPAIP